MTSFRSLLPGFLIGLLMMIVAGCSDPYGGRQEISGEVILDGKPLDGGTIFFLPVDSKETQSGAKIVNGAYTVPRKNGLLPGKYLVRITAGDGKTPANTEIAQPGGSTNIVSVDRIPKDWNEKQQVEVKADGPNKFNFDIPKANTPGKH